MKYIKEYKEYETIDIFDWVSSHKRVDLSESDINEIKKCSPGLKLYPEIILGKEVKNAIHIVRPGTGIDVFKFDDEWFVLRYLSIMNHQTHDSSWHLFDQLEEVVEYLKNKK